MGLLRSAAFRVLIAISNAWGPGSQTANKVYKQYGIIIVLFPQFFLELRLNTPSSFPLGAELMSQQASNRLNRAIERGNPMQFSFDGKPMNAYGGETVAAALLAHGIRALRKSEKNGEFRGVFCGMGVCFE